MMGRTPQAGRRDTAGVVPRAGKVMAKQRIIDVPLESTNAARRAGARRRVVRPRAVDPGGLKPV